MAQRDGQRRVDARGLEQRPLADRALEEERVRVRGTRPGSGGARTRRAAAARPRSRTGRTRRSRGRRRSRAAASRRRSRRRRSGRAGRGRAAAPTCAPRRCRTPARRCCSRASRSARPRRRAAGRRARGGSGRAARSGRRPAWRRGARPRRARPPRAPAARPTGAARRSRAPRGRFSKPSCGEQLDHRGRRARQHRVLRRQLRPAVLRGDRGQHVLREALRGGHVGDREHQALEPGLGGQALDLRLAPVPGHRVAPRVAVVGAGDREHDLRAVGHLLEVLRLEAGQQVVATREEDVLHAAHWTRRRRLAEAPTSIRWPQSTLHAVGLDAVAEHDAALPQLARDRRAASITPLVIVVRVAALGHASRTKNASRGSVGAGSASPYGG